MSNETLSLVTTTNITANQILAVGCGSANSPTYTFKDNATMGMYCASSSPSTLGFSVDGQVRCTMTANEVSANVPLKFSDVTAPTPSTSTEGYLYKKSGQDKLFWQTTTSGELDLTTAAADNLGNHIATQQLQLLLGSVTVPSLTFQGDLNTGLFSEGADRLSFAIGGTKLAGFTITGLGIGTDTPAVPLEVSGTIQGTSITDGTATLTTGSITGLVNATASGTIQGAQFKIVLAQLNYPEELFLEHLLMVVLLLQQIILMVEQYMPILDQQLYQVLHLMGVVVMKEMAYLYQLQMK